MYIYRYVCDFMVKNQCNDEETNVNEDLFKWTIIVTRIGHQSFNFTKMCLLHEKFVSF